MEEKSKAAKRLRFFVEQEGWATQAAIIFMALSAIFRLVGTIGYWGDRFFAVTQILLPLACNLLFILFLVLFGKRAVWTTAIPVLAGVAFFVIKSFGFDSWIHTVLCILLYLLVAILYVGTVFGVIRTKWLLLPLFGLPFLYHVFVEDLPALRDTANPVSFTAGMQEFSVLCIMLALLLTGVALKVEKPVIEGELPKIKAPRVLPPLRLRKQESEAEEEKNNETTETNETIEAEQQPESQEQTEI